MARRSLVVALAWLLAACGDDDPGTPEAPDVYFDLTSAYDTAATFWDAPFPSDLRLNADGTMDLTGFPHADEVPLVEDMMEAARLRIRAPQMPVAYVRFAVDVPERRHGDVIAASVDSDVLLLDIDPASPEQGTLYPVVAETLVLDDYAPRNLVAVAPVPGIVLAPDTTYAVVWRRAFAPDAEPPPQLVALRDGTSDDVEATGVFAPLWPALDALGVAADDVLVATVFTTGDEARRLHDRSERVRAAHDVVITDLQIDPIDGAAHDGFCELIGSVSLPQFQLGEQPFGDDGGFAFDATDTPIEQRQQVVPVAITIPFGEMPAGGWPLYQFFHGSGGLSSGLVDLGKTLEVGGEPELGKGPGYVVARHGIAAASSALPLNPERHPGANAYEYININNLSALPFTFQQGVFEQRLFLDALLELEIPAETLAGCPGVTLPSGATAHHFDADKLVAGGQSMGGMYTNMIGAIEARYGALVPTGAGGLWNLMILETPLVPGARQFVVAALATSGSRLNFMHPVLVLLELGWEVSEPVVSMSRLARRPIPGLPPRPVYEPVGYNDENFPPLIFDAAALAYGNQQAGAEIWPTMQDVLALEGRDGVASYPVASNLAHDDGPATTNVVVQFEGDGIVDPHYLYRQLDEVKHQYGCFFATWIATGTAVVVAPGALTDPCE